MDLNKLDLFRLKIFRAIDEPEMAQDFHVRHQEQLATLGLDGLDFAKNAWISNPSVFVMALLSGQKIIGGSRIHLFNPEKKYPFEEAVLECLPEKAVALDRYRDNYQAEWCGLWLSSKYKGLGLAETMNRAALATTHLFGLDIIYGICPRHTMDLFRSAGFRFVTLNDEMISFPYPTSEYTSYVIECEVREMKFTFRNEKQMTLQILENPEQQLESSGLLGECMVQLTGFPHLESGLLIRPSEIDQDIKRSNLHKLSRRSLPNDIKIPRAS